MQPMNQTEQEIGRFLYDHIKDFKLIGSYAMVDANGSNMLRRQCAPQDIDYIVRYKDYDNVQKYVEDTGSTRIIWTNTKGDKYDFHLLTNADYHAWITATSQIQSVCAIAQDASAGTDLSYILKCKHAFDEIFKSLLYSQQQKTTSQYD